MILLQMVSDVAAETDATTEASTSIFRIIFSSGLILVPIGGLLILVLYILVERVVNFNRISLDAQAFINQVKDMILKGDILGAHTFCRENGTPVAQVIEKGISRIGNPVQTIEASMQGTARIAIAAMEKNVSWLSTTSGAAPLLGLLGTVVGMSKYFMAVAADTGDISPRLLTGGIYSSLGASIAGITVGLIALLAHHYLAWRVQQVANDMESASMVFLDLLQEPR